MNNVSPNSISISPCICAHYSFLVQYDMVSIKQILLEHELLIHDHIVNYFRYSLFNSIYTIVPWFDMFAIRKIIAQTLYNLYVHNDVRAIKYFKNHLDTKTIEQEKCVNNWKSYIINLSMPYANGHIEGDHFPIQWICEILNINIYIWSASMRDISL